MTIYKDASSAIVRVMSAEAIDNTARQSWQKLVDSGYPEERLSGSGLSQQDRLDMDCLVHARLHRMLPESVWHALMAKYSTHKGRKVESIGHLVRITQSPASHLFRYKCVTAWAIPPMRGIDGRRSTDMIVLPAEFYDMSNWENEGRPEQTRRRWRGGIRKSLDALVEEGLIRAGEILQEEGLIIGAAA